MSAAVSVFDWLRAREFKKAMDVEGKREGKKGMTVARWKHTASGYACQDSDGESRGRTALHPIWPAAVVTEISSARTARHKLQAARTDALIGSREKRIAIRAGCICFFFFFFLHHWRIQLSCVSFSFRIRKFNLVWRNAIARRSLEYIAFQTIL